MRTYLSEDCNEASFEPPSKGRSSSCPFNLDSKLDPPAPAQTPDLTGAWHYNESQFVALVIEFQPGGSYITGVCPRIGGGLCPKASAVRQGSYVVHGDILAFDKGVEGLGGKANNGVQEVYHWRLEERPDSHPQPNTETTRVLFLTPANGQKPRGFRHPLSSGRAGTEWINSLCLRMGAPGQSAPASHNRAYGCCRGLNTAIVPGSLPPQETPTDHRATQIAVRKRPEPGNGQRRGSRPTKAGNCRLE